MLPEISQYLTLYGVTLNKVKLKQECVLKFCKKEMYPRSPGYLHMLGPDPVVFNFAPYLGNVTESICRTQVVKMVLKLKPSVLMSLSAPPKNDL